jgi:hypothetical protein
VITTVWWEQLLLSAVQAGITLAIEMTHFEERVRAESIDDL